MKNRKNIKLYAGVGILTLALMMHMGMNITNNQSAREVAFNDSKEIVVPKNDQEFKKKGR